MAEKQKVADAEMLDFLAELDADFGKKKKETDTAASRNKAWHSANQPLEKALGKAPESDGSGQWKPTARVTYVIRQLCRCCNNTTEFIGGEYVMFESKRQHAKVLRGAQHCPNLFLYDEDDNDLPDLIEEFNQEVSRCPGCIAVERQAIEIWESALKQEVKQPQTELNIELEGV
jgi:hypothetical protein